MDEIPKLKFKTFDAALFRKLKIMYFICWGNSLFYTTQVPLDLLIEEKNTLMSKCTTRKTFGKALKTKIVSVLMWFKLHKIYQKADCCRAYSYISVLHFEQGAVNV